MHNNLIRRSNQRRQLANNECHHDMQEQISREFYKNNFLPSQLSSSVLVFRRYIKGRKSESTLSLILYKTSTLPQVIALSTCIDIPTSLKEKCVFLVIIKILSCNHTLGSGIYI